MTSLAKQKNQLRHGLKLLSQY